MDEEALTARQELKRNRTRMFFLEAAKNMIISEGVESVSVRKVADLAGYSYPTLYSYFKDLNELLWEVRLFMIDDIGEYIRGKMTHAVIGPEELKDVFKKYMDYYLINPNIFRFFYFHRLREPSVKREDSLTEPNYASLWNETFRGFVESGMLREGDIEAVAKTLIYAVQGMLTLRLSDNMQDDAVLYKDIDIIIDHMFSPGKEGK